MRRQTLSNLAACALACVPSLALPGDEDQDLRDRLSRTVNVLATYKEIGRGVDCGNSEAIVELLSVCEPAPTDLARAEADLVELRTRVNALQEILDARAVWARTGSSAQAVVVEAAPGPAEAPLQGVQPMPVVASTAAADADSKIAFERPNFVADGARLGRACWRGGRYLEGIAALEALAGDPKADYWRARCLEKLARSSEALALYKQVIEVAGDSPEGKNAREDFEFLEWSISHGLLKTP